MARRSAAHRCLSRTMCLLQLLISASAFGPRLQQQTNFRPGYPLHLFQLELPSWTQPAASKDSSASLLINDFVAAWNRRDVTALTAQLSADIAWQDTRFYDTWQGLESVERQLRLQQPLLEPLQLLEKVVSDTAVAFVYQDAVGRGAVWMDLQDNDDRPTIRSVQWIPEPTSKKGESTLQVLSGVSRLLTGGNRSGDNKDDEASSKEDLSQEPRRNDRKLTPPEEYYAAWNRRDLEAAIQVFDEDIQYDDTAFAQPFQGKAALANHLALCAQVFPASIQFAADQVIQQDNRIMVQWHVENDKESLPFTEGLSFYTLKNRNQVIETGLDFVDSQPVKTGAVQQWTRPIVQEPVRLVPFAAWLAYLYVVFLSDGILPGANALQLEARTWEEVLGLSLNFWFVAPLLDLPFSPSVHPVLEAVFNFLLAYAALFVGFCSDDRKNKPNLFPFGPAVVGMQFLTSAFYLPYLAFRTSESTASSSQQQQQDADVCTVDTSQVNTVTLLVGESRWWAPGLSVVGLASLAWAAIGRVEEYGVDAATRWASFVDLLSIDRVGASFLVDLVIFAVFQGWLVDDDVQRRQQDVIVNPKLVWAAKYVPFFGLAAYLALRPQLPAEGTQ